MVLKENPLVFWRDILGCSCAAHFIEEVTKAGASGRCFGFQQICLWKRRSLI